MELEIKKASYTDWEFIRLLRNENKSSFINQNEITKEEHEEFMIKNCKNYFIAFAGTFQVGFVGVVDEDIRFAVPENFQGQSIGTQMLKFIKEKFPHSIGKVKKNNVASNYSFKKADFELYYETDKYKYWVTHYDDYRIWPNVDELE